MAASLSSLDELGLRFGTDKASVHHDYLHFYEGFFATLRHAKLKILEIGVLDGASLKTWEAYFPNATIIGMDIMPHAKRFEQGRTIIEIADQSNIHALTRIATTHGPFDIVIEDGSHMWEHQITSLRTIFPFVKPDGLYIVEDLQTNYGSMQKDYQGIASESCMTYLKKWLDLKVGDDQIDISRVEDAFLRSYGRSVRFMTFYRRACLIAKSNADRPVPLAALKTQPLGSLPEGARGISFGAHISHLGDVYCADGVLNPVEGRHTLQGIMIDTPNLEYRVCFSDGTWSSWCENGQFAGSKGLTRELSGIMLRVNGIAVNSGVVHGLARFSGGAVVSFGAGDECRDRSGGILCGLQLALTAASPP